MGATGHGLGARGQEQASNLCRNLSVTRWRRWHWRARKRRRSRSCCIGLGAPVVTAGCTASLWCDMMSLRWTPTSAPRLHLSGPARRAGASYRDAPRAGKQRRMASGGNVWLPAIIGRRGGPHGRGQELHPDPGPTREKKNQPTRTGSLSNCVLLQRGASIESEDEAIHPAFGGQLSEVHKRPKEGTGDDGRWATTRAHASASSPTTRTPSPSIGARCAPPVPRLARAVLRALVERACAPEGRASNEGMVCGRVISCAAACSQTRPWR